MAKHEIPRRRPAPKRGRDSARDDSPGGSTPVILSEAAAARQPQSRRISGFAILPFLLRLTPTTPILLLFLCGPVAYASDDAGTNHVQTALQPATNLVQLTDIQKNVLDRTLELAKEAKLPDKPFRSLKFDEKRKQWASVFGTGKPDDGYVVYITDETATRIDILLLPPMWTQYERKQAPKPSPGRKR